MGPRRVEPQNAEMGLFISAGEGDGTAGAASFVSDERVTAGT